MGRESVFLMSGGRSSEVTRLAATNQRQRVEFAGAAERDDEQQTADQTPDDSSSDHSGGNDHWTALLIAAVATVVLRIAHPRLKHTALHYLAVEVPGLAEEAVLLVGSIGAAVLVVAAVRSRVTRSVSGAGEFILLTRRTVQLIPSVRTVPVTVTALLLSVASPVTPAGNLPGQAEPVHLKHRERGSSATVHLKHRGVHQRQSTLNTEGSSETVHLKYRGVHQRQSTLNTEGDSPGRKGTHLVGSVEASGGVDLVGVEVDAQLSRGGNHGNRCPGVEGGQNAQQAARVLLQTVVHLHVISVPRPVQLKVREPQDHLGGRGVSEGAGELVQAAGGEGEGESRHSSSSELSPHSSIELQRHQSGTHFPLEQWNWSHHILVPRGNLRGDQNL
ncbi:hypothetical protein F7725_024608 [Dissostichus mawsoni]|uniref:Uncharacterized protein n=1 Tax=Dissostichus mawsoni TaxID=36200 RepID=A0A7J5X8S3_DISMA|nr:hypothetical protein F7725_024608 [Dissostichus mawsoni]